MPRITLRSLACAALVPTAIAILAGCSGTDTITSPLTGGQAQDRGPSTSPVDPTAAPATSHAQVWVNGQEASGQIAVPGNTSTMNLTVRFERGVGSAPVAAGYCEYSHHQQQGMMNQRMMDHSGRFRMYDDGTHGDDVPHDGIYCFERPVLQFMRSMGMPMDHMDEMLGEHEAEFYCLDEHGTESNHVTVRFTVSR